MTVVSILKRAISPFAFAVLAVTANAQVFHGGVVVTTPSTVTATAADATVVAIVPSPAPSIPFVAEPPPPAFAIDEQPATGRFVNLSTRGWVSGTDKIMIAGLVIGQGGRAVLIRAVGPSLVDHGVNDFLPRPHLDLRNSKGEPVTSAAAWKDLSATNKAEARRFAQKTGAFPLKEESADAVLFLFLNAGIYTCIVTGVEGSSGTALVECYEIPATFAMPSST